MHSEVYSGEMTCLRSALQHSNKEKGKKALRKPVWECLDNADSDAYTGLGKKKKKLKKIVKCDQREFQVARRITILTSLPRMFTLRHM